jgi:hypothetical protein
MPLGARRDADVSVPGATDVGEHAEMEEAMTGRAPVKVVRDQLVLGPVTVSEFPADTHGGVQRPLAGTSTKLGLLLRRWRPTAHFPDVVDCCQRKLSRTTRVNPIDAGRP